MSSSPRPRTKPSNSPESCDRLFGKGPAEANGVTVSCAGTGETDSVDRSVADGMYVLVCLANAWAGAL